MSGTGAGASYGDLLITSMLVLGAVCIAAFLAVRFFGRFAAMGRGRGAHLLDVVARVPLEPRRSLYVVEVAGKTLLVGTSEMGLSVLSELDGAEVKTRVAKQQTFGDLVKSAWQKRRGLADGPAETRGDASAEARNAVAEDVSAETRSATRDVSAETHGDSEDVSTETRGRAVGDVSAETRSAPRDVSAGTHGDSEDVFTETRDRAAGNVSPVTGGRATRDVSAETRDGALDAHTRTRSVAPALADAADEAGGAVDDAAARDVSAETRVGRA